MTNQEKQGNKPLANEDEYGIPREYVATDIELYSNNGDYVKEAIKRVGDTLLKILDDSTWNYSTLLEYLDTDYFPRKETVSRLINCVKGRSPSAAQLVDLRRVFGISLDALADGGDPFVFEQMSDARLVEMMETISREMGRRIRQR